jgi:hypothetical protein
MLADPIRNMDKARLQPSIKLFATCRHLPGGALSGRHETNFLRLSTVPPAKDRPCRHERSLAASRERLHAPRANSVRRDFVVAGRGLQRLEFNPAN